MEEQNQEFELNEEMEQELVEETSVNEIEQLKEELKAKTDENLRLLAEFDNFRKRTAKERIEFSKVAAKEVIEDFLPVLDDLDRAMVTIHESNDVAAIKSGVELIEGKMRKVLLENGLKEMESKGKEFDPEIHEAITKIPAPTDDLKGKVVDEVEKGYTLNDKIIRYPKVVVGV